MDVTRDGTQLNAAGEGAGRVGRSIGANAGARAEPGPERRDRQAESRRRRWNDLLSPAGGIPLEELRAVVDVVDDGEPLADRVGHRADQLCRAGVRERLVDRAASACRSPAASCRRSRRSRSGPARRTAGSPAPGRAAIASGSRACDRGTGELQARTRCRPPGRRLPLAPPTSVGESWSWIAPSVRPSSRASASGRRSNSAAKSRSSRRRSAKPTVTSPYRAPSASAMVAPVDGAEQFLARRPTTAGSSSAGPEISSPSSSSLLRTATATPPTSSADRTIGTTTHSHVRPLPAARCQPSAAQLGARAWPSPP